MNTPGLTRYTAGSVGGTPAGRQPPQQPAAARETRETTARAPAAPARHPQTAPAVLDASDASLKQRNLPRGSIVDIVV